MIFVAFVTNGNVLEICETWGTRWFDSWLRVVSKAARLKNFTGSHSELSTFKMMNS